MPNLDIGYFRKKEQSDYAKQFLEERTDEYYQQLFKDKSVKERLKLLGKEFKAIGTFVLSSTVFLSLKLATELLDYFAPDVENEELQKAKSQLQQEEDTAEQCPQCAKLDYRVEEAEIGGHKTTIKHCNSCSYSKIVERSKL